MATPATALWLLKLGSQLAKYPEKARKYLFKGPGKGKPHRTDIEFEKDTVSTPGSGLRTKYKVKRGPVRYSDPDLSEGGLFVRNPFVATVGTTGAAGGVTWLIKVYLSLKRRVKIRLQPHLPMLILI